MWDASKASTTLISITNINTRIKTFAEVLTPLWATNNAYTHNLTPHEPLRSLLSKNGKSWHIFVDLSLLFNNKIVVFIVSKSINTKQDKKIEIDSYQQRRI